MFSNHDYLIMIGQSRMHNYDKLPTAVNHYSFSLIIGYFPLKYD